MRRYRKGQTWRPPTTAESAASADALEGYRRRSPQAPDRQFPIDNVLIKNASGTGCLTGDILALDDVVIDADTFDDSGVNAIEWASHVIWSGTKPNTSTPTPTYAHIGRFAVLTEPIANGSIGYGVVDGLVVAKLDMDYADHPYADIAHNTYRLTSNWYGAAEILYTEQVDATWWGLVRVGAFQAPLYKGVADSTISSGSSGTVSLWYAGADTSENVTCHLWMEGSNDIASGSECVMRFFRDEQKWVITEAEC